MQQQSKQDNYYDPFEDYRQHCQRNGVETGLERELAKGIINFTHWVRKHSIPVAAVSALLFFGSLRIADSTKRDNPKYNTLEVIQIESVLSARNALLIGTGAIASWYCVRRTRK